MKKFILIALLALGLGFGLTLMASTPSMAVHKGSGDLTCGSCHTMHSSQGGTYGPSMGGANGALILLRNSEVTGRETIHFLCLQCHAEGGSQGAVQFNASNALTTPPKVLLYSSQWTEASLFNTIGAGGDFQFVGSYPLNGSYTAGSEDLGGVTPGTTGRGRGHSIGATSVAPPGNGSTGGTQIATFSCTTCHDPHGTATTTASINVYRNLKGSISTTGVQRPWSNMGADLGTSYVGGPTGAADNNSQGVDAGVGTAGSGIGSRDNIWPVYTATTQNSYSTNATPPTFTGGTWLNQDDESSNHVLMSAFCAQCHSSWHEGLTSGNKATNDWNRHPVNNRLLDASITSGASVSIVDFTHYNNDITTGMKLPAANDDGGTAVYSADSGNDKVFCLSCHFAHGSPYYDILRWNYISAVDAAGGSQTGNGVPSTKGCQQCHNR